MMESATRSDLIGIIEKALEDFSQQQINLKSKAARDAIAFRIASDIATLNKEMPTKENASQSFKELQRRVY